MYVFSAKIGRCKILSYQAARLKSGAVIFCEGGQASVCSLGEAFALSVRQLKAVNWSMEIIKMQLKELRPAEYNPRKEVEPGDPVYESLKNSIQTFGNVEPIVWNQTTGNVVGGHKRLQILLDLGIEESEVSVIELSEKDEKALNIALNKITGEWDEEKLAELLMEIAEDNAIEVTGFDKGELNALLTRIQKPGGEAEGAAESPGQTINACQEIQQGEFAAETFAYECPRCHFLFNN